MSDLSGPPTPPAHPWDGYLVGPENALAQAGAMALARGETAGTSPLVVHGPSGSGKTRFCLRCAKSFLVWRKRLTRTRHRSLLAASSSHRRPRRRSSRSSACSPSSMPTRPRSSKRTAARILSTRRSSTDTTVLEGAVGTLVPVRRSSRQVAPTVTNWRAVVTHSDTVHKQRDARRARTGLSSSHAIPRLHVRSPASRQRRLRSLVDASAVARGRAHDPRREHRSDRRRLSLNAAAAVEDEGRWGG